MGKSVSDGSTERPNLNCPLTSPTLDPTYATENLGNILR